MNKTDNPILGIILILAAFFIFSFIAASGKWLIVAGIPPMQMVFMRYFGHFIISFSILCRNDIRISNFYTENYYLVILRAFFLFSSTALQFLAFQFLPLTVTSTIEFTAPIIICLLSWPILGERVGVFRTLSVIIGFLGVLIIIKPLGADFHPATILSLLGATSFAIYAILSRKLAGEVSVDLMQFYSGLVGSAIVLPMILFIWINPSNVFDWFVLFLIGFFGWLGHQLLTYAHSFADANLLTPFGYSFIIYSAIWSFFISNYLPDLWTIMGGFLIVLSGVAIWIREYKKSQLKRL
ncbi:MAG: DMT family transporter [Paracoccaceae bacterium]|nr:DMT family transporter [Paracoccaceae bacterium]